MNLRLLMKVAVVTSGVVSLSACMPPYQFVPKPGQPVAMLGSIVKNNIAVDVKLAVANDENCGNAAEVDIDNGPQLIPAGKPITVLAYEQDDDGTMIYTCPPAVMNFVPTSGLYYWVDIDMDYDDVNSSGGQECTYHLYSSSRKDFRSLSPVYFESGKYQSDYLVPGVKCVMNTGPVYDGRPQDYEPGKLPKINLYPSNSNKLQG